MVEGRAFASFALAYAAALALHECAHALTAWMLLGVFGRHKHGCVSLQFTSGHAATCVSGFGACIPQTAARVIGAAGWLASVALAWWMTFSSQNFASLAATYLVAAEAVASDVFGVHPTCSQPPPGEQQLHGGGALHFFCGNFGLLLLRAVHKKHVLPILRLMLRTTMVRGCQSAGLVSFRRHRFYDGAHTAKRVRVVNGKRTDLADMLFGTGRSSGAASTSKAPPLLYSGHTRFATSSRTSGDGCHPHRWSPRSWHTHWQYTPASEDGRAPTVTGKYACCEGYVTHNGDLDYFEINGHDYSLDELQKLLPRVLHCPMPSSTDSCCLAGLFDLLRTRGVWLPSVRYGLLCGAFGTPNTSAKITEPDALWPARVLNQVSALFESAWKAVLKEHGHLLLNDDLSEADSKMSMDSKGSSKGSSKNSSKATSKDSCNGWVEVPTGTPERTSFAGALATAASASSTPWGAGGGAGRRASRTSEAAPSPSRAPAGTSPSRRRRSSFSAIAGAPLAVANSVARRTSLRTLFPESPSSVHAAANFGGEDDDSKDEGDDSKDEGFDSFKNGPGDSSKEGGGSSFGGLDWRKQQLNAARLRQTAMTSREKATAKKEMASWHALQSAMVYAMTERISQMRTSLGLAKVWAKATGASTPLSAEDEHNALRRIIHVAVSSFIYNDLLTAGREIIRRAKGSFGLVLSHTLDCDHGTLVAAKGQTMSLAFYPTLGLVLFGSEQAATKAAMGLTPRNDDESLHAGGGVGARMAPTELTQSFRLDLDDLGGEVTLLTWSAEGRGGGYDSGEEGGEGGGDGSGSSVGNRGMPTASYLERRYARRKRKDEDDDIVTCEATHFVMDHGGVRCDVVSLKEAVRTRHKPFFRRVLRLDGNELVQPLIPIGADPVGQDLRDIPSIVKRLSLDFEEPSRSVNLSSTWNFSHKLRKRMLLKASGAMDESVDLLITGCEVSLWAGEQFASDMQLAFPRLKVVVLSANKLLGQLGQSFPVPQAGFLFNASNYSFRNTVVLLISQSGGTFPTLHVANLLRAVTPELFTVTSEWDTQLARSAREAQQAKGSHKGSAVNRLSSYNFTTFAGFRSAEPCSASLVATHTLLTHLLLFTMNHLADFHLGGATYLRQEVQELATLATNSHIDALKQIVGADEDGNRVASETSKNLKAQGRRWAQHILEGPWTWILSAVYICVTVILGATPISASYAAIAELLEEGYEGGGASSDAGSGSGDDGGGGGAENDDELVRTWPAYVIGTIDALLYIFLPIWTAWLLRWLQGRPLLHRVAGRSILIGDIPWVSQSLEAFVSKMFALSYSIASVSVASANPLDHLVHRHTHRVVRGSLVAVGRPDARLNALTTADSATCLALNQACAIVNLGQGCEAITVGHHPNKLELAEACLVLPTVRPKFLSELVTEESDGTVNVMHYSHACGGGQIRSKKHGHGKKKGSTLSIFEGRLTDLSPNASPGNSAHDGTIISGDSSTHASSSCSFSGTTTGLTPQSTNRSSDNTPQSTLRRSSTEPGSVIAAAAAAAAANGRSTSPTMSNGNGSSRTVGFGSSVRSFVKRTRRRDGATNEKLGVGDGLSFFVRKAAEGVCGGTSDRSGGASDRSGGASDRSGSAPSASTADASSVLARAGALPEGGLRSMKRRISGDQGGGPPSADSFGGLRKMSDVIDAAQKESNPARLRNRMADLRKREDGGGNKLLLSDLQKRIDTTAHEGSFTRRIKDELQRIRKRMTIEPLRQPFLGAWMQHEPSVKGLSLMQMVDRQRLVQTLYETRMASMQRFVAFSVLFHQMGKEVQDFWPKVSFGLLGYDMSRSQSMLRVATTAAPISGSEVRERINELEREQMELWAARYIQRTIRLLIAVRSHVRSSTNKILFEQAASGTAELMLAAELIGEMPDHYLSSTTLEERQAHLELFMRYKGHEAAAKPTTNQGSHRGSHRGGGGGGGDTDEPVFVSWRHGTRERGALVYLLFRDHVGALGTITAALSSRGVNIKALAAYSTSGGICLDSLEVDSAFDQDAADVLRARVANELYIQISSKAAKNSKSGKATPPPNRLANELGESYIQSTTVEQRRIHLELYRRYEEHNLGEMRTPGERVQMQWGSKASARGAGGSPGGGYALYMVFEDMTGSLGLITSILRQHSVPILTLSANSTQSGVGVDTFVLGANFNDLVADVIRSKLTDELESREALLTTTSNLGGQGSENGVQGGGGGGGGGDSGAPSLFFAEMPDHYLGATNPIERRAHLELYEAFQTSAEPVQLRWVKNERSSGSRATVTVHVVFTDCAGTLNAITSALLEAGVGILRVAAFCTSSGVAVDTFELNGFAEETAILLKARLVTHMSTVAKPSWFDGRDLLGGLLGGGSTPSTPPTASVAPPPPAANEAERSYLSA